MTPLSLAVKYGNEAIVKLLLETGIVDIFATDQEGQTPLPRAAVGGDPAVVNLPQLYKATKEKRYGVFY